MHRCGHLIFAFGLAALFTTSASAGEFDAERTHVGYAAPVLSLPALNPDVARDLIGSRDVNLDHLCGPVPHKQLALCVVIFADQSSIAAIQKLYRRYQKKSVAWILVGSGADFGSEFGEAAKAASFPVLADAHRIVTQRWGVSKIPSFFILNSDGTVRLEGEFNFAQEDAFAVEFLDHALSEVKQANK